MNKIAEIKTIFASNLNARRTNYIDNHEDRKIIITSA